MRDLSWRTVLYAILSVLINGLDLPYTTSDPDSKERRKSSPTIVFRMAGSTVVGSIISAVIILLAAANDAVFCGDMTASDAIHRQLCVKVLFRLEQEADTLDCCPGTFDISVLRFEIRIVDTGQLRSRCQDQGAKTFCINLGVEICPQLTRLESLVSPIKIPESLATLPFSVFAPLSRPKAKSISFPPQLGRTSCIPGSGYYLTHSLCWDKGVVSSVPYSAW